MQIYSLVGSSIGNYSAFTIEECCAKAHSSCAMNYGGVIFLSSIGSWKILPDNRETWWCRMITKRRLLLAGQ